MVNKKGDVKWVSYHCGGTNRAAVKGFVDFNHGVLLGEYVEGKKKWPQLTNALEKCRAEGAYLVIAAIGRLVRNPKFLTMLLESGVEFACLDNQTCNRHTVHILIGVAEEASERIDRKSVV